MRKTSIYYTSLVMVLALTGCTSSQRPPSNIVKQTYIHKYGVTVPPQDWAARGQHGQVVSEMKDGVAVTHNYSSGILDGPTTHTYAHSSAIEKVQTYARGNLLKEVIHYRSGPPMEETQHLEDGSKKITTWYETGSPKSIENYNSQGQLVTADYYTPNHQSEAQVENKHGIRITRNQYGHIQTKDTIENGEMLVRTTYHYNGTPKEIIPYHKGFVQGKRQTFLPDGEPNSIEEWSGGKQQGLTIEFQNGEKHAEVPYVNGVKQGVEKRYRDGSILTQEISWHNDLQEGPSTTHYGETAATEWYFEGRPVSKLSYEGLIRAARR